MVQVVQSQVRIRVESPERWASALQRAMDANLIYIELIAGDGAWAVSSQCDCERGYIATTHTCTCEAGRSGDPVCCHRALARALVGVMSVEEETPETPPCRVCHGDGTSFSEWYGERRPCDSCGGTGIRPDHRPQGLPLFVPVAVAA
jgi:hypothetical protein